MSHPHNTPIAAIVLAGGASARMGRPKQSLLYRGEPLVRRAARAALDAGLSPVLVVLGCDADAVAPHLSGLDVVALVCPDWSAGMGATLRAGIARASVSSPTAIVVTLCDQPHVGPDVLLRLVAAWRAMGNPIVAARYHGTLGVPALFAEAVFPDLLEMPASAGAKSLLARRPEDVYGIDAPEAATDVDTPEDYRALHETR